RSEASKLNGREIQADQERGNIVVNWIDWVIDIPCQPAGCRIKRKRHGRFNADPDLRRRNGKRLESPARNVLDLEHILPAKSCGGRVRNDANETVRQSRMKQHSAALAVIERRGSAIIQVSNLVPTI